MSKDKLTDYDSTTASNNTDVGGISVAEGMLPSAVNNSIRELTKQLGAFADGTDGIDVLSLADDDASHAIKLQAPSAVTADTTFTLPDGDGTADQVLKTDGSGQLGWADRHANPSLIINGSAIVAQRGTSFSSAADSTYVVDRFRVKRNGMDNLAYDLSQSSTSPDGFGNSIKLDVTTAETLSEDNEYLKIDTSIEAQNVQHLKYGTSSAEQITMSFWVRSSTTGTYAIEMYIDDSDRQITNTYTVNSANTWEYKSVSFVGDTSGSINNDNGRGFLISWLLSVPSNYKTGDSTSWRTYNADGRGYGQTADVASTTGEFYITGVKLEVGDTATPFEHRSYGDELARCQRYCYVITGGSDWHTYAGHAQTGTAFLWSATFPVPMRARASATFDNTNTQYIQGNNSNYGPTAFAVSAISQETMYVNTTSSGMTQGHGLTILLNSANKQIMDAEL